jgi:hypothetical protein
MFLDVSLVHSRFYVARPRPRHPQSYNTASSLWVNTIDGAVKTYSHELEMTDAYGVGDVVKVCVNFVRARIYLSEKTKAATLKKVISEKYHCIIATLAS